MWIPATPAACGAPSAERFRSLPLWGQETEPLMGHSGAGSGQVKLAVLDTEGERLPFGRGEDQHRAAGPLAVAHGDHVVAALLRAGNESDLHAGATVPAAEGRLAPDGAGQVHLSIAFPAGSVEARGNSASALSMSYPPGLRTRCPAPGGRPGGRS